MESLYIVHGFRNISFCVKPIHIGKKYIDHSDHSPDISWPERKRSPSSQESVDLINDNQRKKLDLIDFDQLEIKTPVNTIQT